MNFVIDYEVCALLFLLVTTVYYFSRRVLPTRQNYFFGWLLVGGLFFLALDAATCVLDYSSANVAPWFLYTINIVLLLTTNTYVAIGYAYCVTLVRQEKLLARRVRLLLLLPLLMVYLLVLSTPWTGFAFTLGEGNRYLHGPYHFLLYINSTVFLIAMAVVVLSSRTADRRSRGAMLAFIGLIIIATVLQFLFPRYMLNGVGAALALNVMMYVLQSPEMYTEQKTGLFNRAAMPMLIGYERERRRLYSVVVYLIDGMGNVNNTVGMEGGEQVLMTLVHELQSAYPKHNLIRYSYDSIGVIVRGVSISDQNVDEYARKFPRRLVYHDTEVRLDCRTLALPGKDFSSEDSILFALEQGVETLRQDGFPGSVFVSDKEADAQFRRRMQLETRLMELIPRRGVDVRYYPVNTTDGRLFAADSAMSMDDGAGGSVPMDEMYRMAERHGAVMQLNSAMLERICLFLQRYDIRKWGARHVYVRLSSALCAQTDLAALMLRILNRYSIDPSLLCFSIREDDVVSFADRLEPNMRQLACAGATFLLDEYGSGHADLGLLLRLPFNTVNLKPSLLALAWRQKAGKVFITNLIQLFEQSDIRVGCIILDNEERVQELHEMGVRYIHTYSANYAMTEEQFRDCLIEAANTRWGK